MTSRTFKGMYSILDQSSRRGGRISVLPGYPKLFRVEVELPVPIHVERAAGRGNALGVLHFFRREIGIAAGFQERLGSGALAQRQAAFEQQDALVDAVPVRTED